MKRAAKRVPTMMTVGQGSRNNRAGWMAFDLFAPPGAGAVTDPVWPSRQMAQDYADLLNEGQAPGDAADAVRAAHGASKPATEGGTA